MLSTASRWVRVVAICLGLTACVTGYHPSTRNVDLSTVRSGETAVAQLSGWYGKRVENCGSLTRPAFLCSGVTLRATDTQPSFRPWDPSPDAIAKGGISAAWFRSDMNVPDTTLPNGFILFPQSEAPAGTTQIEVLCAFPFDGDTWSRRTLQGCGPHPTNTDRSRPCQDLGITTAEQWLANNDTPGHTRHSHQCGWDVRIGSPATADRFMQNSRARAALPWNLWRFTSELILRTWANDMGASLPIHSFFYRAGNAQGLENAKNDQIRYFNLYGKALPVVRLTMPTSQGGTAQFAYDSGEQAVSLTDWKVTPQITSVKDPQNVAIPRGGTTYATTVTLGGAALANQIVEVWRNAGLVGTKVADGSGLWTFQVNGLATGLSNFQVRGLYGTQPTSPIRSLTMPSPRIASVKDPQGIDIPDGGTTSARTLILTGMAQYGQSVEVWHSGQLKATALVGADGIWTYQINDLAGNATHFFQIRGLYDANPVSAVRSLIVK